MVDLQDDLWPALESPGGVVDVYGVRPVGSLARARTVNLKSYHNDFTVKSGFAQKITAAIIFFRIMKYLRVYDCRLFSLILTTTNRSINRSLEFVSFEQPSTTMHLRLSVFEPRETLPGRPGLDAPLAEEGGGGELAGADQVADQVHLGHASIAAINTLLRLFWFSRKKNSREGIERGKLSFSYEERFEGEGEIRYGNGGNDFHKLECQEIIIAIIILSIKS